MYDNNFNNVTFSLSFPFLYFLRWNNVDIQYFLSKYLFITNKLFIYIYMYFKSYFIVDL